MRSTRGVLALALTLVLTLALAACASKPEPATTSPSSPAATETPAATTPAPAVTDPAHYPPAMLAGSADPSPTREQRLWALATCAILIESNGGRHDILGGFEGTKQNAAAVRQLLEQWWGIKNRDQLLETLAWIEAGGHRKPFDELAAFIANATPEQMQQLVESTGGDPELQNRIDVAKAHGPRLKGKSIAGWDYARYVWLCGQGYVAGYLSEAEAWKRIMPAARAMQSTFSSWQDLGSNYLVGRSFWSYAQTKNSGAQFTEIRRKLLVESGSPWVTIPWETDLGGGSGTQ